MNIINQSHLTDSWTKSCIDQIEKLNQQKGIFPHVQAVTYAAMTPFTALADFFRADAAFIWHGSLLIIQVGAEQLGIHSESSSSKIELSMLAQHIYYGLAFLCQAGLSTVSLPFVLISPSIIIKECDYLELRPMQVIPANCPPKLTHVVIEDPAHAIPPPPPKSPSWTRAILAGKIALGTLALSGIALAAYGAYFHYVALKAQRRNAELNSEFQKVTIENSNLKNKVLEFSESRNICLEKLYHLKNEYEEQIDEIERIKKICNSKFETQNTRKITFGVTYIGGNSERDKMSKLVVKNHKEYADRWGITQEVETNSLLKGECTANGEKQDCEPYWNKIAVIRRWLNQPKATKAKEEWYIMADDDMPVTNMQIDPYDAIDRLREGKDTSVIIARDSEQWNKGCASDTSVNTGLLIVRKDEHSRQLFDKIWKQRNREVPNDPGYCPTLGVCKKQFALHEQQAFANYLAETTRSVWEKIVSVVEQREEDSSSPRQSIALNTFHRARKLDGQEGCFFPEGHPHDWPIQYGDDPFSGRWQKGDWMGQATGIPSWGRYCDGDIMRPLRLEWLQEMIAHVVR